MRKGAMPADAAPDTNCAINMSNHHEDDEVDVVDCLVIDDDEDDGDDFNDLLELLKNNKQMGFAIFAQQGRI